MAFFAATIFVNLSHNSIAHFLPPIATYAAYPAFPIFQLDHNPFLCDCHLYPYINAYRRGLLNAKFFLHAAMCAAPPPLAGVALVDLLPDQLVCNEVPCPDDCTCLYLPAAGRLELNCLTVPHGLLAARNLPTRLRMRAADDLVALPAHVTYVDLSALNLTAAPRVSGAVELDLRDNRLADVPVELLKRNCVLHMAGNPLRCACRDKHALELLSSKRHLVPDFRNLTCANRLLLSDVGEALCAAWDTTVLGGSLVLFGVLTALVTALGYRYQTEARILLRKFGLWPAATDVQPCRYDAFVSFSHLDERYVVESLVPRLERGRDALRLCLHYRDWAVGDFIPAQITASVEESRRTIVVLSEHFLRSVWACMEMRVAHGRERLLVLLLGELPAALEPELRAYIAVNTYVRADDPLVIERLKDAVLGPQREARSKPPRGLNAQLNAQGQLVNANAA